MKIRVGFVSNSSTTSFCIFGVAVDSSIDDEYEDTDEMSAFEVFREKVESVGLRVEETPDDYYVIGMCAQDLPMDKTLNEMVAIISEKLKTLGIKFGEIEWHEESWHDG